MTWHAVLTGGPRDGDEFDTDSTTISVVDGEGTTCVRQGFYFVDKRLPVRRAPDGATVAFYWAGWDDGKP